MHYRIEHPYDIDPNGYWEMFFSDAYNDELYKELRMTNRKTLELKDEGNIIRRVQQMTPPTDIPSIFKSVIKDTSYIERNVFYRDKSVMEVIIEPQMLKNKFDMRANYSVVPNGDGKCKRIFEGDVKVSIMLLGGQIEKFMVEQLKSNYEITDRVTKAWIAKHKPAA
jgi:hypothetical protein